MGNEMRRLSSFAVCLFTFLATAQTVAHGELEQLPIEIEMHATKTTILLGEPLWVDVTMTNRSNEALIVDYGNECWGANPLKVQVEGAQQAKDHPHNSCNQGMGGSCGSSPAPSLEPGESITRRFVFAGDFRIDHPGTYKVLLSKLLRYRRSADGPPSSSHPIDIEETGTDQFDLLVEPASPAQLLSVELRLADRATSEEATPSVANMSHDNSATRADLRKAAIRQLDEAQFESTDQRQEIAEGLSKYPVTGMESVFQSWVGGAYSTYGLSALKKLDTPESRASLADIAKGGSDKRNSLLQSMRFEAVDALADLGDKKYVPLLEQLAKDGSPDVRHEAIEGLGRLGGERELGFLVSLARSGDTPYDRVVAIRGISETKSRKAVSLLIDLVSLPDSSQPGESYYGLSLLTHLDFPGYQGQSVSQVREVWRRFWAAHERGSVMYGRDDCLPPPTYSQLLVNHSVREMRNPGVSLSIAISPSTVHASNDIRVSVALKNESKQEVSLIFDVPTEILHLSIRTVDGKRRGCDPPFVDGSAASPGPRTLPAGRTLHFQASFKDWACPSLQPGRYSLTAYWDLDDVNQNIPSSIPVRIASNRLDFNVD